MDTKSKDQSVGADVTDLPDWLVNTDPTPALPDTSDLTDLPAQPRLSKAAQSLWPLQFEAVYPRILDLLSSGYTLTNAIKELPLDLDPGAFLRWIKKDPQRHEAYKEAKEIRTEAWAGKLVEYAEAADTAEDVQRSKLKVDTLKWLMAADNRRTYGDSKTIELGGTISVLGALAAAQQRVIDAEVVEVIECPSQPQIEQDDES